MGSKMRNTEVILMNQRNNRVGKKNNKTQLTVPYTLCLHVVRRNFVLVSTIVVEVNILWEITKKSGSILSS